MAMRETKSSTTSSQSDSWAEFYQHQPNISSATTSTMFSISDASNTNTAANPTGDGGGGSVASSSHLSPDGRVSKPIRRRSRASRRTPTTLLNTDPANFRAMVQQFTGGSGGGSGGFTVPFIREASNLHFGQQILPNPNQNRVGIPPGAYYNHLQLQQQQQQQQQQSLHPYQQRPYMFSDLMSNMSTGQGGFDMGTEGIAISIHAPPRPNQNSNSNGSNNSMF